MPLGTPSFAIRLVTATAVLLAPLNAVKAQSPGEGGGVSVLTSQAVGYVRLAPRQLLTSPIAEQYPVEVATAAGLKYLGIDPVQIESIELAIEPPAGPRMFYGAAIKLSEPYSLDRLSPEVMAELMPVSIPSGGDAYRTRDPNGPVLTMADERTLLLGSEGMIKKLLRSPGRPARGDFVDWLTAKNASHDLHAAIHFAPLSGLVQMAISAASQEIPPEVQPLLGALNDVRFIDAWMGVSQSPGMGVSIEAHNEAAADRLDKAIDHFLELQKKQIEAAMAQLDPNDPIEAAWIAYGKRVQPSRDQIPLLPKRDGVRYHHTLDLDAGDESSTLVMVATIGVLVALLLPAVQAAREAARRNVSMNQMKQMMLAMHVHHDVKNRFPAQAICAPDGTPLLSWRVAILPFLEQQALYDQFHLDEPWDSPHNRTLIEKMPKVYNDPSHALTPEQGKSHYLGIAGPNSIFDGSPKGRQLRTIRDGTSKSMAIVQVGDENAVVWTKPQDYDAVKNAANPAAAIGGMHPGVFLAAFADGHVAAIPHDHDPANLRALMTVDGMEPAFDP